MNKEDLDNLFTNKKMSDAAFRNRMEIEHAAYGLANAIYHLVPDSREQSLAFTKLEEAIMWANKGLSRHGQ